MMMPPPQQTGDITDPNQAKALYDQQQMMMQQMQMQYQQMYNYMLAQQMQQNQQQMAGGQGNGSGPNQFAQMQPNMAQPFGMMP